MAPGHHQGRRAHSYQLTKRYGDKTAVDRLDFEPAVNKFRALPDVDRQVMGRAPKNEANAAYWFEHELRQCPAVELDLDALTARADRIVPRSAGTLQSRKRVSAVWQ
jgi:hypothetical protein